VKLRTLYSELVLSDHLQCEDYYYTRVYPEVPRQFIMKYMPLFLAVVVPFKVVPFQICNRFSICDTAGSPLEIMFWSHVEQSAIAPEFQGTVPL
jgi:hypothetical protein